MTFSFAQVANAGGIKVSRHGVSIGGRKVIDTDCCSISKEDLIRAAAAARTLGVSELAAREAEKKAKEEAEQKLRDEAAKKAESEKKIAIEYAQGLIAKNNTEIRDIERKIEELEAIWKFASTITSSVVNEILSRGSYMGQIRQIYKSWAKDESDKQSLINQIQLVYDSVQENEKNRLLSKIVKYLVFSNNSANKHFASLVKVSSIEGLHATQMLSAQMTSLIGELINDLRNEALDLKARAAIYESNLALIKG